MAATFFLQGQLHPLYYFLFQLRLLFCAHRKPWHSVFGTNCLLAPHSLPQPCLAVSPGCEINLACRFNGAAKSSLPAWWAEMENLPGQKVQRALHSEVYRDGTCMKISEWIFIQASIWRSNIPGSCVSSWGAAVRSTYGDLKSSPCLERNYERDSLLTGFIVCHDRRSTSCGVNFSPPFPPQKSTDLIHRHSC